MMTEMHPDLESVTAVLTSHMESGENFDGAISLGFYSGQRAEVFIQAQGVTINIQCADVDAFCKQLKRAKKLAQEQPEEPR
jgi:hypothetical protein